MPRTLVVAPNWIGDALMAQPMLARLRAQDPGGRIEVLAPDWVAPVVRRMAEVDEVISAPFRHGALQFGLRFQLGRRLRQRGYDRAYVLPNTLKAALVPFVAKVPLRVGYLGEMRYGLINRVVPKSRAPMRERYARLAGPGADPAPRLRIEPREIGAAKKKFGVAGDYAVLCPGAEYGPAKRWPYFDALAKTIGIDKLVLGSAADHEAARGIAATDLTGKTTLDEAIALIAGAKFVVSNDSGLMHVAAALGRPQVALFGSSSPEHTPPQSAAARVLWLKPECSPCYQRVCPLGHFKCMRELTVDRVAAELEKFPP